MKKSLGKIKQEKIIYICKRYKMYGLKNKYGNGKVLAVILIEENYEFLQKQIEEEIIKIVKRSDSENKYQVLLKNSDSQKFEVGDWIRF